jgi:MYXO-CTERM domain-containing protein
LFCTNGFCCGSAKCDDGASCGVPGSEGTCTRVNGSACKADPECGSGHCVDGVCCDRACDGQCEACDVFDPTTGLAGKCIPVKGVPHGARTACEKGSDVCGAKQCDGTTVASCASPVGSDVLCRTNSCVAGVQTLEAKCDGMGGCPAVVTKSCAGFACTLDGLACETACTTADQCAAGYRCEGGLCVEPTARCSTDGRTSIAKDGAETPCSPYSCRTDGKCGTSCATSTECAPGNVCSSNVCVPTPTAAGAAEDSGGCSVATRSRAGSPLALLALAMVFALRRRRVAAAIALGAMGCSTKNTPEPPPAKTEARAASILAEVRAHAELASGLRPANMIAPHGAGLAVVDERGPLRFEMPARADGPARIESARDPSVWLEIRSDAGSSAATVQDGAVVYDDVVLLPSAGRLEEVRIARRPASVHSAKYTLRVGPGATVRLRSKFVEVVDAKGYVHVATEPMYALDARGTRRDVVPSLHEDGDHYVLETRLDPAGLAYPIAIDPAWNAVASMNDRRTEHQLISLPDGRVMAIGGSYDSGLELGTNEIYNPVTNTWSYVAPMAKERWGHGAAYITSGALAGRVVVAGGTNGGDFTVQSSIEIYNVSTNTWTTGPTMKANRSTVTSALVSGTKVFLTSGTTGEVYDTALGTTTAVTNAMSLSRYKPQAIALPTGNVLVLDGALTTTVHLWRAATNDFVVTTSMPSARNNFVTALAGGRVLVAGGNNGTSDIATSVVYDPASTAWSATGSMNLTRNGGRAVTLQNGRVLAIAGNASTTTEIYDPAIGLWTTSSFYSRQRSNLEVALLANGSVIAAGGFSGKTLANADLYSPDPLGNACSFGYECLSGYCTNGVCCSTATCAAGALCNRPKTLGTCSKGLGVACTTAAECESGSCVDGVCCNVACGGQCEACNVAGKVGTCFPVSGAPIGARGACASGGTDPCAQQTCDGFDGTKCHYLPAGVTKCGATGCKSGVATTAGACNGAGVCNEASKSCGAYACAGNACATTCAAATDCATGFYCDTKTSTCVASESLGQKCSTTALCKSGLFCTDGYCCGVASCGEGATCGWFGKEGSCTKTNGSACAADAECGSAHCVDGVCCDSACTGQCEACDIVESSTGRAGRCLPTVGAPHGKRTECSSDPSNECSGSQCGGEDRTKCTAFKGSSFSCRTQSCADGVLTLPAQCDGKGGCPAVVTASCEAYACSADGTRCRASCAASSDCASGFVCVGDKCEKRAASCSDDKASSIPNGGTAVSCAPYRCIDTGACGSSCHTSDECAAGFVCDPSGTCLAPPAAADDGGCAYGHSARSGSLVGFALAALALSLARRRRA